MEFIKEHGADILILLLLLYCFITVEVERLEDVSLGYSVTVKIGS